MAVVTKIASGSTVKWGTTGTGPDSYGKIQRTSRKRTAERTKLLDENGETLTAVYFDAKDQCEIEVLLLSGTPPARGASITIAGLACLVDEVETKWANNNAKMLTIRATKYTQTLV
jgi:hypothetical protein